MKQLNSTNFKNTYEYLEPISTISGYFYENKMWDVIMFFINKQMKMNFND